MASHSLASLPTSGLYGASGWIEDNGILQLMRPYVDSPASVQTLHVFRV